MLTINTNVPAIQAVASLSRTQNIVSKLQNQLSTGKRIVDAATDPAGISISTKMSVRISSMKVAKSNVEDAISVTRIADGGMKGISESLKAIRELVVKAKSDTNTAAERTAIKSSIDSLVNEIGSYVNQATFNGIDLLDGTADMKIQSGPDGSDTDTIKIAQKFDATTLGVNALAVDSTTNAGTALTAVDAALATVDSGRTSIGALQKGFEVKSNFLSTVIENTSAALSRIEDIDYAETQAELYKYQALQQANVYALSQALQNSSSILGLLR